MGNEINVVYKRVGEPAVVGKLENTYEALKAYLNEGYLEAVPFCGATMYLDEEGKLKDLAPNFPWMHEGQLHDIIVGDVVFVNTDDEGCDTDLTKGQIAELMAYFEAEGWYMNLYWRV